MILEVLKHLLVASKCLDLAENGIIFNTLIYMQQSVLFMEVKKSVYFVNRK